MLWGGGKIKLQKTVFILSIITSICYFLYMPKVTSSIFHTNFHFICHFSIMVMGGLTYLNKNIIKMKSLSKDFTLMSFWFIAYFIVLYISKGYLNYKYYLQIIGLLPLHLFIFYIYKVASYPWCTTLFQTPQLKWIFLTIANLTLEIYIVQFHIITDKFNALFPLNTIIVFILISISAYALKFVASLFLQFLSPSPFNLKEAIKIY